MLPDAKIVNGSLYVKLKNKDGAEEVYNLESLRESRYSSPAKYSLLRNAGLIKWN